MLKADFPGDMNRLLGFSILRNRVLTSASAMLQQHEKTSFSVRDPLITVILWH